MTNTPPIQPHTLQIPDFALIVLIGCSGSGKSTFAARHFLPTEVLSSDAFRGWVSDEETCLEATGDAFDALHYLASIRLRRRKTVVVDATNVQPEARKPLLQLAQQHDALAVAIVLNLPESVCQERNKGRPDRSFGPHVVRTQSRQLRQSLRSLRREGFRQVYVLESEAEIEAVQIERVPLWTDRRAEHGPFDIIGDVHGCYDELVELLTQLGYRQEAAEAPFAHPEGRRAIFLGDLVDRGPSVVETVRLVMRMVAAGSALCVPGNHDVKLMRALQGRGVQITHGLGESLAQIERLPEEEREAFRRDYIAFVDSLVSHYWLDEGRLVVAHAGMKEAYQGRASGRVRDFALYGETTGETDEFGLPVRYPWTEDYRGTAMVVYGHTPVPEAEWLNRTINIDTGCVFGGRLTALRYPEREIAQVPARRVYAVPVRPLKPAFAAPDAAEDGLAQPSVPTPSEPVILTAQDVLGKRIIHTRLAGNVIVEAEYAAAAFEVMSRFAVDPRWPIYLPPTMSPSETTSEPGYLEYPREAFGYYRGQGVAAVVCQTKHMGSRAVVIVCRDEAAARRRFGVQGAVGECYTRTGRRFFEEEALHRTFLEEVSGALTRAGFWEEFQTDWVCLDAEMMPWNAKAQSLLRDQYAAVGAAAQRTLEAAREAVRAALARLDPANPGAGRLGGIAESLSRRADNAARYTEAYAHYCWPVRSLNDYRLAPFHLLATEGKAHFNRDHGWHAAALAKLAAHSDLLLPTDSRTVDLLDESSQQEAIAWWLEQTEAGGEGMVVKPLTFVARGPRGLAQPAVKVRGREYLRIIYGPDYTEPENLQRLRQRSLAIKRILAAREFALGVEGLERFVRGEPLSRVHECAFAVLALESEPVDPRL